MSERTTPTPWPEPEYDNSDTSSGEWWDIPGVAHYIYRESDARLICRAVNTHAEMVEALKEADRLIAETGFAKGTGHQKIRSALNKACPAKEGE